MLNSSLGYDQEKTEKERDFSKKPAPTPYLMADRGQEILFGNGAITGPQLGS